MPGLQADGVVAALGSPIKKSKLSLKFFQKKDTKRALDFSETQAEEQNTQPLEAEEPASCDQVVPGPCPTSPLTCERRESLVPFVGLNNLGNTCYLNSILQVLYYCPGFKDAIKKLHKLSKRRDKQKEAVKNEQETTAAEEPAPAQVELLGSFYSLITSVEQLQSNFLLSPDKYSEGELATPPRKLLNSLRQLNPMYEGYLQHDAQEVLQCILGYVQEASESICKEQQSELGEKKKEEEESSSTERRSSEEEAGAEGQLSGKRKSDTEAGNAKKKPKSQTKGRNAEEDEEERQPLTRSKRKSSGDITAATANEHPAGESQEEGETEKEKEGGSDADEGKSEGAPKETGKRKKRARLSWLKSSSGKQPSIFSKFRSMGRLTSHGGSRTESREDHGKEGEGAGKDTPDNATPISEQIKTQSENENKAQNEADAQGFDVLKRLFQGQLVLRTRCLECECFTERREDFQDISVPVQEDEPAPKESCSEVSPEPKPELKTLKWAISQFASVERIVGEDKYFCETCHHYTEAERSLLFDKTPEVITIHLKCFAANTSELDPYAGLSKVNTPLQTPLQLSLEEWSTGAAPRGQQYQLFAVVMHSGVTISSGHYTTYIRMADLHKISLQKEEAEATAGEEELEAKQQDKQQDKQKQKEPQVPKKEEAAAAEEYDDGEVSFSLSGRGGASASAVSGAKAAGKKALEGVGLLGGQRSLATYELGSSTKQQPASAEKSSFPSSSQPLGGAVKEKEAASVSEGEQAQGRTGQELALHNLLDYEGKWMLFDDSEVRLFEEEDFLRACSPETCSTSTPYLLFYRRVEAAQK